MKNTKSSKTKIFWFIHFFYFMYSAFVIGQENTIPNKQKRNSYFCLHYAQPLKGKSGVDISWITEIQNNRGFRISLTGVDYRVMKPEDYHEDWFFDGNLSRDNKQVSIISINYREYVFSSSKKIKLGMEFGFSYISNTTPVYKKTHSPGWYSPNYYIERTKTQEMGLNARANIQITRRKLAGWSIGMAGFISKKQCFGNVELGWVFGYIK